MLRLCAVVNLCFYWNFGGGEFRFGKEKQSQFTILYKNRKQEIRKINCRLNSNVLEMIYE